MDSLCCTDGFSCCFPPRQHAQTHRIESRSFCPVCMHLSLYRTKLPTLRYMKRNANERRNARTLLQGDDAVFAAWRQCSWFIFSPSGVLGATVSLTWCCDTLGLLQRRSSPNMTTQLFLLPLHTSTTCNKTKSDGRAGWKCTVVSELWNIVVHKSSSCDAYFTVLTLSLLYLSIYPICRLRIPFAEPEASIVSCVCCGLLFSGNRRRLDY
jgi:hypothetical protein